MAIDTEFEALSRAREKRHTRPRGTPTKILSTPVHVDTYELIASEAKAHNCGYGEVVDFYVAEMQKRRVKTA